MPKRPFAVLFDLDGTLIDTIGLLLECVHHTFQGRTPAPTDEEWIEGIGTPLRRQLAAYASSEKEIDGLIDRYRAYQRIHHDRLTSTYPGVIETLTELERRGHPMGVVTSKSNEMMDRGVTLTGLARFMKTTIGADSCTIHKPEAFPVLLALKELGYSSEEGVFLGDSPHDVQSGNAAGVVSIAALWGPFTREQLAPSSPMNYLENITGLPMLLDQLQSGTPHRT